MKRVLFIDRDGTIVREAPPTYQLDSFEKVVFYPEAFQYLSRIASELDYELVMVTNQDGLGTSSFPRERFEGPHRLLMQLLESQGIRFDAVLICPHLPGDGCACRKPQTAMIDDYVAGNPIEPQRSFVVGDRETDLELARNLGIGAIRILKDGSDEFSWAAAARCLTQTAHRRAQVARRTKETDIEVSVDLDAESPVVMAVQSWLAVADTGSKETTRMKVVGPPAASIE